MSHQPGDDGQQPVAGDAGHGDHGGEEGTKGNKAQQKPKVNKFNCSVCKKSTKKVASNKDGGVRCGVCLFWWHPTCINMDSELLNWIVMGEKLGNDCCWTCQHCQEAHVKTEQAIKAMSSRMNKVEQKVEQVEAKQDKMEDKQELNIVKQDKVNNEFEERLRKLEQNSGSGVIKEVDDRMGKLNNLVVYRVPELASEDPTERQAHDAANIKVVMKKFLGIKDMDTDHKLRFIKRMGMKGDGVDARLIILGLRFTADLEMVLDRSWMLGQSTNKAAKDINIVRDLTVKQRQKEAELVTGAAKKNMERSQDEWDQDLVYKVVGRKGEKREIKVTLRHGEEVDDAGNVTRRDGWGRGNRRDYGRPHVTGGNSEPIGNRAAAVVVEAVQTKPKSPRQENVQKVSEVKDTSKVSGDWEWGPAAGKRGRQSPSPDKVLKKVKAGAGLELKNRFQHMAQDLFGEQEQNLL